MFLLNLTYWKYKDREDITISLFKSYSLKFSKLSEQFEVSDYRYLWEALSI